MKVHKTDYHGGTICGQGNDSKTYLNSKVTCKKCLKLTELYGRNKYEHSREWLWNLSHHVQNFNA